RAVLEAMLRQSDPKRICKYLRAFMVGTLDDFDSRLLQFASHPDEDVRGTACRALSNYEHPEVRRLALERLTVRQYRCDELRLLVKNYRAGDELLINGLLIGSDDEQAMHDLGLGINAVAETNPTAPLNQALLFVYEQTPCSICRHSA